MDLTQRRILVTGSGGFLGQHVMEALAARGCRIGQLGEGAGTSLGQPITQPRHHAWDDAAWGVRSRTHDLTRQDVIRGLLLDLRPQVIIHLAALCGGIGANRDRPGEFYYKNLVMGAHLMEEARLLGVEKFVAVGTVCAYPKHTPVPFREQDLWSGYPEETNAPYGLAKKMLLVQAQAYRRQYGFNAIYLLPVNLYGPGDNFDPHTSHVIPAMIRKFVEARHRGDRQVTLWGTGQPTREFLYAPDCARAIVSAAEQYNSAEPMNLGSGAEISIAALATMVADLVGYTGEIIWDHTKPDGQPRRCLDTTRARALGPWARTPLLTGLAQTVRHYESAQTNDV